jgi:uncharacterized protein YdaU (DUF1376 family)
VNYYKHHIGDYAKKTVHLSPLEHGVYLLMLHAYYGTEKPLPTGEALYRIARAQSKAERAAVDSIASQFWNATDRGLVNGRAFEELEAANHMAETARRNGTQGGRPKITQSVINQEPSGFAEINPAGFITEPTGKAIQTPDSTIQNKKEPSAVSWKPKSKPKTPFPEDLKLSEAMRQVALARYADADVDEMFSQFRAHHQAHGKAMKSWEAAWRTWVGNSANFGYPKRPEIVWR